MPYIGNQHNVGDHVNNFKVLDDISSHTATFDGSATSVIDTTNNSIRVNPFCLITKLNLILSSQDIS